jgi:hypothetical protein
MGGTVSFWTQNELEYIEKIKRIQSVALNYISKEIYYGIPIKTSKKSPHDPISFTWIEPIEEQENDASLNFGKVK